MDEELAESLWIRIKERAGTAAIAVGAATAAQPGKQHEILCRQVGAASH